MSKRLFGVRRDLGSYAAQVAATARDDCARNDQARLPARLPREQQTAPGLSFGLNSPPSGIVHRRPPTTHLSSSRTVADPGERWAALLESVLGATPQEFESPILRHADQGKHRSVVPARWRFEARWSHLLVSVLSAQHHLQRDSLPLFCQVTGIADRPEERTARRRSVRLTIQGWPGPSAADRIPAEYIPHHIE